MSGDRREKLGKAGDSKPARPRGPQVVWTRAAESLSFRPVPVPVIVAGDAPFPKPPRRGVPAVPSPSPYRRGVESATAFGQPPRAHGSYLCLAVAALAAAALLGIAGCQTARAPMTVAPPATGMIGQPAPYGVAPQPMGAAYPAAPPMPGPVTQWQASAPAAPPAGTWSWAQPQPGAPALQTAPQMPQMPSSQSLTNQAQQYGNQMQAQAQQFGNQMQNSANQQWQQMANQTSQQTNQYMNQATQQANQYMNQAGQQAQQYLNGAQQQVTAQMPTGQPPAVNTSWNPFSTPAASMPPARATPVAVPRY
jgi:gas vesicle protein